MRRLRHRGVSQQQQPLVGQARPRGARVEQVHAAEQGGRRSAAEVRYLLQPCAPAAGGRACARRSISDHQRIVAL